MSSNQSFKNKALNNLEGNWGDAAIVALIYCLIAGIVNEGFNFFMTPEMTVGSSFIWMVVCFPLGWGFVTMFLDFIRSNDKLRIGKMFEPYATDWGRIMTTYLLLYVYIILWTLLLIVPGIIKLFSYSMTPYILKDHPELNNNGAIEKSMRMMQGHKMDLFLLELSFIGWFILSLMTLGIGFIFLIPYVNTALAHFYEELKAESND